MCYNKKVSFSLYAKKREVFMSKEMDYIIEEEIEETEGSEEMSNEVIKGSSAKKEGVKRISEVLQFLTKELGCNFPKKFAEMLYEESNSKESFTLTKDHARGIIDDWRVWEEYVNPADMDKYIRHKLEVFCKIHCGVTYGFNRGEATAKSYIGTYAEVIKQIPENKYVIIHSTGMISVDGKMQEVDENDPRARHTSLRRRKKGNSGYGAVIHHY